MSAAAALPSRRARRSTTRVGKRCARLANNLTEAEWAAIRAPTQVIWTSHDPTALESVGRRIAELIPDARFALMQNCGHWPQFEDPQTFNRLHIDFLLGKV